MKKQPQDLTALLTAYDETQRKLEQIRTDAAYIEQRTREIFGERPPRDYSAELSAIIAAL